MPFRNGRINRIIVDVLDSQKAKTPGDQVKRSGGAPNGLLEMPVEMCNFFPAPVDGSQFAVPSGSKKAEPDQRKPMLAADCHAIGNTAIRESRRED